jgi:hypothetical protein
MPAFRRHPSDLSRSRGPTGDSRVVTFIGALAIVGVVAGGGALVLDDPAQSQDVSAAGSEARSSAPGTPTPAPASEKPSPTTEATAVPSTSATTAAPTTPAPAPEPEPAPSTTRSTPAPVPASAPRPAPAPASATKPAPAPEPAPAPAPALPATGEREIQAYMTGYSYFDTTPAGSPSTSHPIVHRQAGGTGTYEDPITVAVGHSAAGGEHTLDWAAGTRFYVPAMSRYLIVEDTCGNGAAPQNGACHTGHPSSASTWLRVWVDGRDGGSSAADSCMGRLTRVHAVIVDPGPGRPVNAGPIASGGGCAL